MNVRSSTRATSLGVGARIEAPRPLLLVQPEEGAGLHQLVAEEFVLRLRAVDPVNGRRLGQIGHLLHPADQVLVGGGGRGGALFRHRMR